MSDSWARAAAHAAAHHGVVSAHEAGALGIGAATLHGWARSGRLLRPCPEAYVVAGSQPTWHQRVAVATASSAGWASHRTAAALWRLDGYSPGRIEVLTAHGAARRRSGWVAHETRHLDAVDLADVDGIACTAVPRTLLDLAAVSHPHRTAQALDDACRRWPWALDAVTQRFLELAGRGRRGSRLMRDLLDERHGTGRFTQSGFEAAALRLVRLAGLPTPVTQHPVRHDGFVAFLDIAWPHVLLGLECDSLAHHSGKRAHEWDRLRRRTLKVLGWDVIEVTYDDVTKRPEATADQLRTLYARRDPFWQR